MTDIELRNRIDQNLEDGLTWLFESLDDTATHFSLDSKTILEALTQAVASLDVVSEYRAWIADCWETV